MTVSSRALHQALIRAFSLALEAYKEWLKAQP